jgi:hypothetical protein
MLPLVLHISLRMSYLPNLVSLAQLLFHRVDPLAGLWLQFYFSICLIFRFVVAEAFLEACGCYLLVKFQKKWPKQFPSHEYINESLSRCGGV